MSVAEKKKQLRRIVMARRREYREPELAAMSAQITERLLGLEAYERAETVFAYMDLPGEVQMRALIARCRKDGKKVAVPRVITAGRPKNGRQGAAAAGEMRFYEIKDFDSLTVGAMHIPEPDPERCPCMDDAEEAFVIMPGVAFDRNLNRIGYGGGYYDRYLRLHGNHFTAACAYDFQIFDEVPHEATDIRPRILVTPGGIFRTSQWG